MAGKAPLGVTVNAFAKINLTLRVLGLRRDGYHRLRTTLQSLALHDTLTFQEARGPLRIHCNDPSCPTDRTNLVWQAAEAMWHAAGRGGRPANLRVRIVKRIPVQAGLGGGSSDAAAALRGLAALWRVDLTPSELHTIAARLGADVPFFLEGGAALGLDRGDLLFPLVDQSAWVTLVIPAFGISTKDAYRWWDDSKPHRPIRRGRTSEFVNDLQQPVVRHRPEISSIVRLLRHSGARLAAMSGSGSAVFGLFDSRKTAERAARLVSGGKRRVLVTRTLSRTKYKQMTRPR